MYGLSRKAFVAVGAMVALGACGGTSTASTGAVQPVDLKLMVGGLNKQIYLPNMLAKQLGYFDDQKINVTLVDEGSGQGTEDEVVAGNVDAGSGAYSHPVELNTLGKKIETKAGYQGSDAHFVAVGAGNTFIAAIKNGTIDAGMTTEPTITRLLQSGDAKVLIDLRTPESTRAALGGDYPFIGIFAKNDWVNSHKDVAQRLVNVYVKTLKWMAAHSADDIAAKMPADYLVPSKDLYVAALKNQLSIFGTDCKMPAAGPQTVLSILQNYVSSFKGKNAKLSETYTNEFANKAS